MPKSFIRHPQIELHPILHALGKQKNGQHWMAQLPILLDELGKLWGLELLYALTGSTVSLVVAAKRERQPVILKLQWPHPECEFEGDALNHWDGNGAITLLEHDRDRNALLLEPCFPGKTLSQCRNADHMGVMINLLPKLWTPAGSPFQTLSRESTIWAANMQQQWLVAGKPCEQKLIDAALDAIANLRNTQSEQVLLHQDLHGDNVLASIRGGWLAIDPKPLIGERAFALSPIIRSFEFGANKKDVLYRLDRLSSELNLDRERARGWALAQSIAWSFDSKYAEQHYNTARWLLHQ